MPALLNAKSSRPNAAAVFSKAAFTSSVCVTLHGTASARPPCCSIKREVSWFPFSETSASATVAPSRANARAAARPMPFAAPVTKATLPANALSLFVISCSFQMLLEKGRELVERDKFRPVVEVNVAGVGNNDQFLWLTGKPVGLFTEFSGMSVLTRDEKHGTRRNCLNVRERVEIHELDITAERRVRGEFRRAALGREFTSRSAVEVIKLTLNRVGVFIQFMARSAGVFGLTAGKFCIALLRCFFDDFLPLLEGQGVVEP